MKSLNTGLVAMAALAAGCRGVEPVPEQAPPTVVAAATPRPPIDERVAAALRQAAEEGTHWHRTDALVRLGAEAVPPLQAVLVDPKGAPDTRVLAAQALGRIGDVAAVESLQAVVADAKTPAPLRTAGEEALFLLGRREPVERRIDSLRARHADIAIAQIVAEARVAQTLYATARFGEAADLWRALVRRESDPGRAGFEAYDWACCCALAGRADEALEAVAVAVKSKRTDLDWMERDGDLRALHGNSAFAKLLADARAARGKPTSEGAALHGLPGYAEYRELHHGYWDVAFEGWIEAQNKYWEGYESWLAANGKKRSEEASAEYRKLHGAEPEKPTREWVEKFRAFLARHREDAIGAEIRTNLLTIFTNEDMHADWVALFLEAMETPGQESVVGENARAVGWMGERAGRRSELDGRLRKWLDVHPTGSPAAQVRLALAESVRGEGAAAAARAAYEEIVRLHPGTREAEEATGALYEMDNLAVGMTAPEFDAQDIRGAPLSLAALRGRVVVLDFWATWCGPCVGEVPHVIELDRQFHGDGFALVGVSLDQDGMALADFLEERAMTWPQVCDLRGFEGALPKLFHVRGIPDTFVVGRDGRILARGLRGEDLAQAVEKALAAGR